MPLFCVCITFWRHLWWLITEQTQGNTDSIWSNTEILTPQLTSPRTQKKELDVEMYHLRFLPVFWRGWLNMWRANKPSSTDWNHVTLTWKSLKKKPKTKTKLSLIITEACSNFLERCSSRRANHYRALCLMDICPWRILMSFDGVF